MTKAKRLALTIAAVALGAAGAVVGAGAMTGWFSASAARQTENIPLAVTRSVLEGTSQALDSYKKDMGRYPSYLGALSERPAGGAIRWRGPYLEDPEVARDGWGNALRYRPPQAGEEAPTLHSVGPNGVDEQGAGDDVVWGG